MTLMESWPHQTGCVFLLMVVTHLLDPDEAMEVSEMLIYELAMK